MKSKKIFSLMLTTLLFVNFTSALSVSLTTTSRTVEEGKSVKVRANFTENILKLPASAISVDGGNVQSVRKMNGSSYLIYILAASDSKEMDVQIEAEKVQDLKKNFNDGSSNELVIKITKVVPVEVVNTNQNNSGITTSQLGELLDKVVENTKNQTPKYTPVAAPVQYYMCNGVSIPTTQTCTQQSQAYQPVYTPSVYNPNYPSTGYYDVYGNYILPTTSYGNYNGYGSYNTYSNYDTYYYPPRKTSIYDYLNW